MCFVEAQTETTIKREVSMTRCTLLLILLLLVSFSAFSQGSSIGSATSLSANGSASGTLNNQSTTHYWQVTTSANGYLRIEVNSGSLIDADVTLYDTDGTSTILYDGRSGTYSEVYGFLKPGTYYVKVYRWTGTTGTYTITSSFSSPSRAPDTELNDSYSTAISANLNGTSTGHLGFSGSSSRDEVDFWKITTTQDGWLRVQVRSDSLDLRQTGDATLDVDVYLYDIDGTTTVSSDGGTGTFSQVDGYLRPGTYFVKVYLWHGRAGSYEIKSDLLLCPSAANDPEQNDSYTSASTLTFGIASTGHIGYRTNGLTDTQDYWRLVAPSSDSIYVHVTSDSTVDMDVTAYGSDGATYVSSDGRSGVYSRIGIKPTAGATYYIRAYKWQGTAGSYSIIAVASSVAVGIAEESSQSVLPTRITLDQNYPNPFNPTTTIRYTLPKEGRVRLAVYSILGQEIAVLHDGVQSAASYSPVWDGKDKQGIEVPSGIYLIRLQAGGQQFVRKAVLVR
jgi:hypothetical protein